MKGISRGNFGLVIVYLVPGFIALWGVSYWSGVVRGWLVPREGTVIAVIGMIYAVIAALAAGVAISAVRRLIVDRIHHHLLGVREPKWDFSNLGGVLPAFEAIVEDQYRYYQIYANTLVALVATFVVREVKMWRLDVPILVAVVVVAVALLCASRGCLKRFYQRGSAVLAGKTA